MQKSSLKSKLSPKIKLRYVAAVIPILLLMIGWSAMSVAANQQNNRSGPLTISGTGSFMFVFTRTITPIDSCIDNLVATSSPPTNGITYTGFLSTNTPGATSLEALVNTCVPSNTTSVAPGYGTTTLPDVTVSCGTGSPTCPAGFSRTGGLVVSAPFVVLSAPGFAAQIYGQFTIVGGTGQLKGVTGSGNDLTNANNVGYTAASDYWLQLTFSHS
jgi:hypothetical protein